MSFATINNADLTPYAKLLLPLLRKGAKGHLECWAGNESLAATLGCCERTIRNALTCLEKAGLIEIIRDYTRKTRRRIYLLWLGATATPLFDAQVAANPDHQSRQILTPSTPPPSDSPYKEPEGIPIESDGCAPIEPPPPIREEIPEEKKAAIMAKAQALTGAESGSWVRSLGKRFGWDWLPTAFNRAEAKAQAETLRSPRGYITAVLRGFAEEGGPPPTPLDPEEASRLHIKRMNRAMEEYERNQANAT